MVFHIENINCEYQIDDIITSKKYQIDSFSGRKKKIEKCLENIRKTEFSLYPSRMNCIYVCNSLEDVKLWVHLKYAHKERDFLLLTLALEKSPIWLSAKTYHEYINGFNANLQECAKQYWESIGDPRNLEDCEGLYDGKAVVKRICKMHYYENGDIKMI